MRKFHLSFLFVLAVLLALPARAEDKTDGIGALLQKGTEQTAPENLTKIDSGIVLEILRSDAILLDNNKRYRLDNVRTPPYEDTAALDALKQEFLNKKVFIYTYNADNNTDRYGLPLVHVMREDDGRWAQGMLISKGLAWLECSDANRDMIAPLRLLEKEARDQKQGFWAREAYAIKTPDNVGAYLNSFQLVEGKILSVNSKKENLYLNFGRDWTTDFTIRIPNTSLQKLINASVSTPQAKLWQNIKSWENRPVRVRGWIEDLDGPALEVTQYDQLEFLPLPAAPKKTAAPPPKK